ncbi:Coproporphyrinogen oxidase [Wolfiporia cocos MD-104 SS10]|uniref:coproporphyrinogen oxidase n=1 Tax=Wolfiporia cocos (strain MD-104) TaxID=742152 RepID=A0A2H3J787_WOLCO|nr:Coproporphyrinogen oxidase [Wolfiporia cocos MD-104 SS10]
MSTPTHSMRERAEQYFTALQQNIVVALQKLDPEAPPPRRDEWSRPQGGGGTTCVFAGLTLSPSENGSIFEKAGISTSVVHSVLSPAAARHMGVTHPSIPKDPSIGLPMYTTGISVVVHARNPHAPSIHMHYRYVEVLSASQIESPEHGHADEKTVLAWWFGGGTDLTPTYLYEEDAHHFHKTLKSVCDAHGGTTLYPACKQWCDEFFYIPHRQEHRGVGGIFFRGLSDATHARLDADPALSHSRPRTQDTVFAFIQALADGFLPSYLPILERRMRMQSDVRALRWQGLRRGRYVEFNLVCEPGTKFGLSTPGVRVESVLMTIPETARWEYMSEMGSDEGSEEGKTIQVLKHPREWV